MGEDGYMSPEPQGADLIDARTEIYSLGVLIYEMSSRILRQPEKRKNLKGVPIRPRYWPLRDKIKKATAERPEERYYSVKQ